jgi:hypothetical protein
MAPFGNSEDLVPGRATKTVARFAFGTIFLRVTIVWVKG